MSEEKIHNGQGKERLYTKQEIENFVAEISRQVVGSSTAYMHAMLALNHILRQSNAEEFLDHDVKEQIKDLWIKLKSMGLQLNDPPILFGAPDLTRQPGERSSSDGAAVA